MSRHNRDRRNQRKNLAVSTTVTKGGEQVQRVARRLVVTQMFERRQGEQQWTLVNTDLDCGGLNENDAAKVLYGVAAAIVSKSGKEVANDTQDVQPVRPGDTHRQAGSAA